MLEGFSRFMIENPSGIGYQVIDAEMGVVVARFYGYNDANELAKRLQLAEARGEKSVMWLNDNNGWAEYELSYNEAKQPQATDHTWTMF